MIYSDCTLDSVVQTFQIVRGRKQREETRPPAAPPPIQHPRPAQFWR